MVLRGGLARVALELRDALPQLLAVRGVAEGRGLFERAVSGVDQ